MTSTIKDRLLLITIWVVACLVVWPTGEWPVNDDWAYVRAVQNLRTGAFHYEDWQGMPLFSQVLFGYPFLGLGGDGFLALRIPMMVLAFIPLFSSDFTWSNIKEIKGEMTTTFPSASKAGTW